MGDNRAAGTAAPGWLEEKGVDVMAVTISEELKMLDGMAKDFATKELVDEREEHDHYPFGPLFESVLAKALEVGFYSVMLPEDMGGSAEPISALCVVLKEVCRADASLGGIIFTNALAQEVIAQAGGKDLLARIASEDGSFKQALIAFPSYNNPAEVDHSARAVRKGASYELSGSVEFVVLGGTVGRALLPARVEGTEGHSWFLVDLGGEGIEASEAVLSLGLHACPAVDLSLSSVPGELIGDEGNGDAYFEAAADRLSVAAAAMSAGTMQGSFVDALDYCKQRMQGGREIVNWSEVRMLLSSMAVAGKVADMLVEKASEAVDREEAGWQLASRATALQVQKMATEETSNGIQLLGGYGYMKDYGQEKRFRDAKQIQVLMGITPVLKLKYIRRIIDGELPW
jgi:alkylation response protein AidB-like acyl-CoA dehydrogenase